MNNGFQKTCGLTKAARSLWAKTGREEQRHLWEPLYVHLADTAEMARLLWRKWIPTATKSFIADGLSMTTDDAEILVAWLAGVHDIGKATPSFQSKVPERAESLYEMGFDLAARCVDYPHSFMSEVLLNDWLVRLGQNEYAASGLASTIGGHHGANPVNEHVLTELVAHSRVQPLAVLGDKYWQSIQDELLGWVFSSVQAERILDATGCVRYSTYAQILITGLIIMADWIASNTRLFPLMLSLNAWNDAAQRANDAWSELGLPSMFSFAARAEEVEELFHRRFANLRPGSSPRQVQLEAVYAAQNMKEPGLIIIEAPMGCGKTEASLLCAEIVAERFMDGGIAYLLPTQATSNAMFSRVKEWLASLLADTPDSGQQDLHLLHGKAALNDDYASLPRWEAGWMGDTASNVTDAIIAHQWFGGRKRGLLAPFVVGTIDQLLMAALNARHAHLKHLGLSGKVIVIDEVHAYDAYMNVYLDRVLAFLGAYGVPVILLSATLPPSRRSELVNAYRGNDKRNSRRFSRLSDVPRLPSGNPAYPLITTSTRAKDSLRYTPCEHEGVTRHVAIEYLPDDDATLIRELQSSLSDGGCACVLRDTVVRAQATYELLRNEFDGEVRLAHSRFIAIDRIRNDAELVELLGPNTRKRPKRLVVVATQVLEQSLDVDFDLLITDVAPIDLLLQRMGRLHRHVRGDGECERPAQLRQARCLITGVSEWGENPPTFARGIDAVYQPTVLWNTILALHNKADSNGEITLPDDIASLVEVVYEGLIEAPDAWKSALVKAGKKAEEQQERKEDAAQNWLINKPGRINLDGWMRGSINIDGEARGRAAVRDSEESIEVVIIRQTEHGLEVLPWVAEQLGVNAGLGSGVDVPDDVVAHAAALCTVSLPPRLSAPYISQHVIEALESSGTFDGWQYSRWLAGELPLVVNESGMAAIGWNGKEFVLHYSREKGLSLVGERGNEQ